MTMSDLIRTGDPEREKHVPFIDAPDRVRKGERIEVRESSG